MMLSVLSAVALLVLTYNEAYAYLCVGFSVLVGVALFFIQKKGNTHGRFISIDYYAQHSKLRGVSPQIKIVFALAMLFLTVACPLNVVVAFVLITMSAITLFLGKTKPAYYLSALFVPGLFILLGSITLAVDFSSTPFLYEDMVWHKGYMGITKAGQEHAVAIVLKSFSAVSCLYMLSFSTPMSEVLSVLRKAKIPSVLVELLYLTYRYIFVVVAMLAAMNTAAKARLGNANLRAGYASFFGIGFHLLIRSLKRASTSFDAMESRCYEGEIAFLTHTQQVKPAQVAAAVAVFTGTVLLWIVLETGVVAWRYWI